MDDRRLITYKNVGRSLNVFVRNRRRLVLPLHVAVTSNFNLQLHQLVVGSRKSALWKLAVVQRQLD
ncbi:hypothetical protein H6H01_26440 [Nostoc calcicola FACHB-3891]|nr:hypothetical protein [Nostoc calcicola FACHB-3891]